MRSLEEAGVVFAITVYVGVDQTAEDDVAAVIHVDATDQTGVDELATGHRIARPGNHRGVPAHFAAAQMPANFAA